MIKYALKTILINDTTVKAITTSCFYSDIPQGSTYPLILLAKISGVRDHHLRGPSGHAHPRYQVDSWAATDTAAQALAKAVRKALDGYSGTVVGFKIRSCLHDNERDGYEPELKIHKVMQDYMIWFEE